MGVDGVNTTTRTYTPVKRRGKAKLNVDGVPAVGDTPKSSDEESQGRQPDTQTGRREREDDERPKRGGIDEHI